MKTKKNKQLLMTALALSILGTSSMAAVSNIAHAEEPVVPEPVKVQTLDDKSTTAAADVTATEFVKVDAGGTATIDFANSNTLTAGILVDAAETTMEFANVGADGIVINRNNTTDETTIGIKVTGDKTTAGAVHQTISESIKVNVKVDSEAANTTGGTYTLGTNGVLVEQGGSLTFAGAKTEINAENTTSGSAFGAKGVVLNSGSKNAPQSEVTFKDTNAKITAKGDAANGKSWSHTVGILNAYSTVNVENSTMDITADNISEENTYGSIGIRVLSDTGANLASVNLKDSTVNVEAKSATKAMGAFVSGNTLLDLENSKLNMDVAAADGDAYGIQVQYGGNVTSDADSAIAITATTAAGAAYGINATYYAGAYGNADLKGKVNIEVAGTEDTYGILADTSGGTGSNNATVTVNGDTTIVANIAEPTEDEETFSASYGVFAKQAGPVADTLGATGQASITLNGKNTITANLAVGAENGAKVTLNGTNILNGEVGAVTGGVVTINGDNTINGLVGADQAGSVRLQGTNTINAAIVDAVFADEGSAVSIDGTNKITGIISADADSSVTITGKTTIIGLEPFYEDNLPAIAIEANDNGTVSINGENTIKGSIIANDSVVSILGDSAIDGAIVAADSSMVMFGGKTNITGDILVDNKSDISLSGTTNINGDITASAASSIDIGGNTTLAKDKTLTVDADSNLEIKSGMLDVSAGNLVVEQAEAPVNKIAAEPKFATGELGALKASYKDFSGDEKAVERELDNKGTLVLTDVTTKTMTIDEFKEFRDSVLSQDSNGALKLDGVSITANNDGEDLTLTDVAEAGAYAGEQTVTVAGDTVDLTQGTKTAVVASIDASKVAGGKVTIDNNGGSNLTLVGGANGTELVKGAELAVTGNLNLGSAASETATSGTGTIDVEGKLSATNGAFDITGTIGDGVEVVGAELAVTGTVSATTNDLSVSQGKLTVSEAVDISTKDNGAINLAKGGVLNAAEIKADNNNGNAIKIDGASSVVADKLTVADSTVITVGSTDGGKGVASFKEVVGSGATFFADPAWNIEGADTIVGQQASVLHVGSMGTNGNTVDNHLIAGQNSLVVFGGENADSAYRTIANSSLAWGKDVTAAMAINKATIVDTTGSLVVDGTLTTTPTTAGNTVNFAEKSLLLVDVAGVGSGNDAITVGNGATVTVADSSKLMFTGMNNKDTVTVLAGDATAIADKEWADANVLTSSKLIKATKTDDTTYEFKSVKAKDIYGKMSDQVAGMVDSVVENGQLNPNSAQGGVKFISRATEDNLRGFSADQVASIVEGGAKMVAVGAVQGTTYDSSNTMVNFIQDRTGLVALNDENIKSQGELWAVPVYTRMNASGMSSGAFSTGYTSNMGGLIAGYDKRTADSTVGFAVGYLGGSASSEGDFARVDNKISSWNIGVYGSKVVADNTNLSGYINYLRSNNDLTQSIAAAMQMGQLKADVSADAFSAGVKLEKKIGNIVPHIGLNYTRVATGSYDINSTTDGKVFSGKDGSQNVFTIPLGVSYENLVKAKTTDGWNKRFVADASMIFAMGTLDATTNVTAVGVTTAANGMKTDVVDRFTFAGTIGFKADKKNFGMGLGYQLQASSKKTGHNIYANLNWKF